MSRSYPSMIVLLALGVQACAGEAATDDFGNGHPGGSEPPTSSPTGESTPIPNFPGCLECYNTCYACVQDAGEDEGATLGCLFGTECRAYLAQFYDPVPDNETGGNILQTPDAAPQQSGGGGQCQNLTNACDLCVCLTGSEDSCQDQC